MQPQPLTQPPRNRSLDTESVADRLEPSEDSAADSRSGDAVRRTVVLAMEALDSRSAVLTSGLGMEGCALIDMLSRSPLARRLSVVFLDTDFHFAETLELFERLDARYSDLRFERVRPAMSPAAQAQREGDVLWSYDPDRCCDLRKIEPLAQRLRSADLWISALRRSQAPSRAEVPVLASSSRFGLPKLAPLAAWSRAEVWQYVQAYDVPFHPMHLRSYPTVGCRHCTLPVPGIGPSEYSRDGRWSLATKTECGLHQAPASADSVLSTPLPALASTR